MSGGRHPALHFALLPSKNQFGNDTKHQELEMILAPAT
jgi:hypothetical protein